MANIPFKSITFPGLPNKYTVPEISNDLMTAGKAADAKATGDALSALEDQFSEETDKLKADLGDLDELETTDKSSIVAAINEAAQSGGGSGVSEDMALALLGVLDVVAVDSSSSYAEVYANFKRAWGLVYTYYSITYALSNVESTSDVITIKEGLPYTTTLSADNQMTVSVTMGGVDVTSTAYSNGVVTISEVTGNIVITASAAKNTTPKGTVNSFINTDGSVQTKAGAFATDAYEIKDGDDKIRYFASNATNGGVFSGSNKMAFYDSSGKFIAYFTTSYSNSDPSTATPANRDISSGAATFRITLHAVDIDKSYAYINNTGRVLFAGANTPYYDKDYITDL